MAPAYFETKAENGETKKIVPDIGNSQHSVVGAVAFLPIYTFHGKNLSKVYQYVDLVPQIFEQNFVLAVEIPSRHSAAEGRERRICLIKT